MASERQIAANRRNGAKGGPKTEEGKNRSRMNSLMHGLAARTIVVLPNEDQSKYDEMHEGFSQSFNPENPMEAALVERITTAQWRSLRAKGIESGILYLQGIYALNERKACKPDAEPDRDFNRAIGAGFMVMETEYWKVWLRYDSAINSDLYRAIDTLMRMQNARRRAEKEQAAMQQPVEPAKPVKPVVLTATATASSPVSSRPQVSTATSPKPAPSAQVSQTKDEPDALPQ